MGTIIWLSLPLLRFSTRHGHHSPSMVTSPAFFIAARAPFALYGYRSILFYHSTGTIRAQWLPLHPFLSQHGHHSRSMVTAPSFFITARAPFTLYSYLSRLFYRLAGTIRALWLPLLPFLSPHGHHSRSMVTTPSFFIASRAPFALYGYRSILFYRLTGTIGALWLPLHPFLSPHGHHSRSMVTALAFFIASRAPFTLYGYRSCLFYHSTGTIRPLWLPLQPFLSPHGHHKRPMPYGDRSILIVRYTSKQAF